MSAAPPLRVLCAPNAFKGTLDAATAAEAMARGARGAGAEAVALPMADGGDGTLAVLAVPPMLWATVTGPLGEAVAARWGRAADGRAVVESAEASGLRRLPVPPTPETALRATSRGTGELIAAAVAAGAQRIVVGVGGSACTDGGQGALSALGAELGDQTGWPLGDGGGALTRLGGADLAAARAALDGIEVVVAVDVAVPLLGPTGAAATFAPQKGADGDSVAELEAGLARWAEVTGGDTGPGTGAAGGLAYGLALIGARIVPGAPLVAAAVGLDAAVAAADLVITGEGRLDAGTATGKAPHHVRECAATHGVPCAVVAGAVADGAGHGWAAVATLSARLAGDDDAAAVERATGALVRGWLTRG